MAHSVFHSAQVIPINIRHIPTTKTLSSSSPNPLSPAAGYRILPVCRKGLVVRNSSATVDGDPAAGLERCFKLSPSLNCPPSSSLSAPATAPSHGPQMKKGPQIATVTLEKRLGLPTAKEREEKEPEYTPELATGGGGGDMGKSINFGGGDGGDDDGDDDDYFDDFDEEDDGDDGGLFRRRIVLPEVFDKKFLEAVLNEWQKTMMDLPSGFRQAYEMGLVSTAQLVKYLAINARPTTARFISRTLPQWLSRGFIGRMISDPAFLYRLLLEQGATIGSTVLWEVTNRKERIKEEWDLALINVLTVTACNTIVVWSLAPCRSYGNTFRFDLQNTLQKLPNNIFEKSYPLREFDMQKRVHSFFYKAAELCMVGLSAGALQGALSNLVASKKQGRLSVTIPAVNANALGYGAFLGIYANLRYQLLCGFDRSIASQFDVIGVGLFFSTALRILNTQIGETSRLAWLGVEVDPLAHSEELLKQAYNRPSEAVTEPSSKWFISKKALTSGLGLLGFKQGESQSSTDGESAAPRKARRKRVVRKKATA